MADLNFTNKKTGSSSGQGASRSKQGGTSPGDLGDQALSAGQDLTDKAKGLAGDTVETLKGHAADLADAASDAASQTTEKLKDAINDRKSSGADYISSFAETMRRAAKEFDNDQPVAGSYIRKVAEQVDSVSESIRVGDLNDIVRHAQSFARRQPATFLGIAVLAGFGIVRFLKSSTDTASPSQDRPATVSQLEGGYRNEATR